MGKLTDAQVREELGKTPGWEQAEGRIARTYKFPDFKAALAFTNRVGELAEAADHHPDILILYNKVRLTLSTHSAGGLTEKDFALAREIDRA